MLKKGWNVLVEDESIFMHDSIVARRRRWIMNDRRPMVTVTGSHSKTVAFGVLSLDGKQLFRQYERFDSQSFVAYLEDVKKKFGKFIMFADRATQHRSGIVREYLQRNSDTTRIEYFPVGSPEFNAVEECWRQGKYSIPSNCPHSLSHLKEMISQYYRTRRFSLDIKKYLFRSTL